MKGRVRGLQCDSLCFECEHESQPQKGEDRNVCERRWVWLEYLLVVGGGAPSICQGGKSPDYSGKTVLCTEMVQIPGERFGE